MSPGLVFVGGLHRSGTSLLAALIAEHPQGSGLAGTGVEEDEGQHLQKVYPPASAFGGPGRFARDRGAHLTETSPLVSPESAAALMRAWEPYWDLSKAYLVEKSPPNMLMGRFLQELFPEAYFVFIIRHPVTVSLATDKWRRRTPFGRLLEHWFVAHDQMTDDLPYLRRVHVIKYEHLLARPDETLAGVGAFLGLDSPLDSGSVAPSRNSGYTQRWNAVRERASTRRLSRYSQWKRRFGVRTQSYGYDFDDLDIARPFAP